MRTGKPWNWIGLPVYFYQTKIFKCYFANGAKFICDALYLGSQEDNEKDNTW